jgi:hypothetical protein
MGRISASKIDLDREEKEKESMRGDVELLVPRIGGSLGD